MSLNADQGMGLEPFEVEVTKIAANQMERRCLLHKGVLDTSQDEVYCLAGFTYAQQIAEQVSKAKGKKTFEEMVPEYYRDFAKSSRRKNPKGFQSTNHGTTQLILNQM